MKSNKCSEWRSPVEAKEGFPLRLQSVPVEAGHLGVVAIPVVVSPARLSILVTCEPSPTLLQTFPTPSLRFLVIYHSGQPVGGKIGN